MFWFNHFGHLISLQCLSFKYILCFGSTSGLVAPSLPETYLNTSYVLVRRSIIPRKILRLLDLNTSYVLVQLPLIHLLKQQPIYLNTSYVLVQPGSGTNPNLVIWEFKYILCFGSTISKGFSAGKHQLFKYILCFGSTAGRSNYNAYAYSI